MDQAVQQLADQGVIGLICVILLVALRTLFKLYCEAQEKRIAEAVENRGAIERNTSVVTALTELVKERLKG